MDEYEGWVVYDRKLPNITRVYVELFADGAIELMEGQRVLVLAAPISYELTDLGREMVK